MNSNILVDSMIDHINDLHTKEKISDWQKDFYLSEVGKGLDDNLFNCLLDDADTVKELKISSNKEWDYWNSIYVYAGQLFSDCYEDIHGHPLGRELTASELSSFSKHIYSQGRDDINKYASSIHINAQAYGSAYKWIKEVFDTTLEQTIKNAAIKIAYPSAVGLKETDPQYNVSGKWIETLTDIYQTALQHNVDRNDTFKMYTADWDSKEVEAFKHWKEFYEADEHKKYKEASGDSDSMKKDATGITNKIPDIQTMQEILDERDRLSNSLQEREEEIIKKFKRWRKALEGRLCSAIFKVLPDLQSLISEEEYIHINDSLMDLLKFINKLRLHPEEDMSAAISHVSDRMTRTANICRHNGMDSIASDLDSIKKESCSERGLQKWGQPSLDKIIQNIEVAEEALKSRALIRTIMSIDVQLSELGMASYFPELGDAIAKLFEAFSYSSNKVSEVVSRLRGGERSKAQQRRQEVRKKAPAPSAPAPKRPE